MQDEAGAVAPTPGLPRGDDEDPHAGQPNAHPWLTVVVATRDRPALLADLLDALPAAAPTAEVVVVDSAGSDPGTPRVCAERGVRLLRADRPGTSRARNLGWRAATTACVAFTDDDCLPQPGWEAALRRAFEGADVVTGAVHPDRAVAAPVSLLLDPVARPLTVDEPVGHGCNAAFRREILHKIGGFDERLGPGTAFPGSEDHDLLRRALTGGAVGRYAPDAVVVHRQWRTRRSALATSFRYGVGLAGSGRARHAVVQEGWRAAVRDARAGYRTGVLVGVARAAGGLAGAVLVRARQGRAR